MPEGLRLERARDGIATLTLSRPPANAVDLGLVEELLHALAELCRDPPAALLMAGEQTFFSAGADLNTPPIGPDGVIAIDRLVTGLYGLSCPVVVAVNGHAIGIGLIMALCGDVRLGVEAGRYGLNEVALGFAYPRATLDLLTAELTPLAVRRLTLGSALHDARTCLALGVLDELVAPDALMASALAEARRRGAMPAAAYALTKSRLRRDALIAMAASTTADATAGHRQAAR